MMMGLEIKLKDLVLIGGGHSHVHVIKMMGMNPIPGLRVILITKDIESLYSGMIPGYVAGYYTKEECHIDLGKLCSFANISLYHTEVINIDPKQRLVHCKDGRPPLKYDVLSINIGIVPKPLNENFYESNDSKYSVVTAVKPIDKFATKWEILLNHLLEQSFHKIYTIAIVGGGAGGVELCFAIQHRIQQHLKQKNIDPSLIKVILLNRSSQIMSTHSKQTRDIIMRLFHEKDIQVFNNADICNRKELTLISKDGRSFYAEQVFWCTQAIGPDWLRNNNTGIQLTNDGFIEVQPTLESVNIKNIFASGDICHNQKYPRPKAGVFAVRAGPPLYINLCHAIRTEPLEEWIPQEIFLGIIGTGSEYAVASKGGIGIEGSYLWKLKDRIDRKWMLGYQQFPDMQEMMKKKKLLKQSTTTSTASSDPDSILEDDPTSISPELLRIANTMGKETIEMLSKSKMRCGGCGSKVGAQILTSVLNRIKKYNKVSRPEILSGITGGKHVGDDAALVLPPAAPAYLVHTIDYFRSFIKDPYVMGQIAVNHALSDIYAMNADPVSALALCIVPYGPEDKMEDSLVQMLSGALKLLNDSNCALVGGHTCEGSDPNFGLGFSVTGVVHPDQTLPKGPLLVDHVLILTKSIGTGTILAADMQAKAKGIWVQNAIENMLLPNRIGAKILYEHGCVACTDVTGFGLLGHMIEMIQYGDDDNEDDDMNTNEQQEQDDDVANSNKSTIHHQKIAVNLYLSMVPVLVGAIETIKSGIVSSLQPQNIRCSRAIDDVTLGNNNSRYPLLFDPQTSGGLLACVPITKANDAILALHNAGYKDSTIIGTVIERNKREYAPLVNLVV